MIIWGKYKETIGWILLAIVLAIFGAFVIFPMIANAQMPPLSLTPVPDVKSDLQAVIDSAPLGTVKIELPPGDYWHVEPLIIQRQVQITSPGALVHCSTTAVVVLPSGNLYVDGVTLQGPEPIAQMGRSSDDPLDETCGVRVQYSGAHAQLGPSVIIKGFYVGTAALFGASLAAEGSKVIDCISHGYCTAGGGKLVLTGDWLSDGNGGDGVHISSGANAWIMNGIVQRNMNGIYTGNGGQGTITKTQIINNLQYGLGADSGSMIREIDCVITGNKINIYGEVLQ